MQRVLAGFALLLVALSLIVFVGFGYGWPALEAYRMAPRVAFKPQAALPPGSYEPPSMWLARPDLARDPAHYLPPGIVHERRGQACVFFLHPTTFMGRKQWNGPLDHADSRMRAELAVRSMASVFNDEAGIWAPRYRQAALGTFMVDSPDAKRALAMAEGDARMAFATFLAHSPPTAPIVLAGHNQGALIALHLLRDTVRGTPIARRIVAVYLTGWPVSPRHDLPQTGMPACTRADQAGCVMAWMTFTDPADPRQMLAMASHYPALDGARADDRPLCTNPLTGGAALSAPAGANRGSLAIGDELRQPSLVLPSVGARCDPASGLLIVTTPPHLGDHVRPGNDFTAYDLALFWRNLRSDVAAREAAWQRAGHP